MICLNGKKEKGKMWGGKNTYHVLTSQVPECGWGKAEESSSFCCALTSQLLEWLQQRSASFVGEGCSLWNQTLGSFLGS